ncbi:hypothetical protein HFD88_001381 [Aspergillus terreus]|nr:hypothetical protein HFD88_001381 [Aspergillus terreus]
MSYKIASDAALSPPNGPAMVAFMEQFYATSDTESQHQQYLANFTPDATLIMGPKSATGSEEILALRHGLWTHVATRAHFPARIYFGGKNELMLYGTVKYRLRADPSNEVEVPWGARVVFADDEKDLKMKFYQVYLDTAAQSGKK